MRRLSRLTGAAALLALAAAPAAAQKLTPAVGSLVSHDANDVLLSVSNRGGYGLLVTQSDPGNFPRGTNNRYLFGSGLWVGGIGDVDANGVPDTITSIGFNPSAVADIEWIEGVPGFGANDPRFRVLDTTVPADLALLPFTPIAAQELFTVYSDRFSVGPPGSPSIPLGLEVRQRSFAFTEPALESSILFQWDFRNVSGVIRSTGYTIRSAFAGIVLDTDIGVVTDDTAAPLEIDGATVLLMWDADFAENGFTGRPGFFAVVPLEPGGASTVTQMASTGGAPVLPVPQLDDDQYRALAGIAPWTPTIAGPGFDLRALVGWPIGDIAPGAVRRTAAAFVWAEAVGTPPDPLDARDPGLVETAPYLADLVAAVRAVRTAYAQRVATLPAALDFPGEPEPGPGPGPGGATGLLQNFPNPFTEETTVQYDVETAGEVRLDVLDAAGRLVVTLANGRLEPGRYTAVWDGTTHDGGPAPAGVYVIRLAGPGGGGAVRALKRP